MSTRSDEAALAAIGAAAKELRLPTLRAEVARVADAARRAAAGGAEGMEVTLEANPGTVDRALVTGGEAPGQVQFGDRSYPALSFGVTVIVS